MYKNYKYVEDFYYDNEYDDDYDEEEYQRPYSNGTMNDKFYCGVEDIIKDYEDGVVKDFKITGFGAFPYRE